MNIKPITQFVYKPNEDKYYHTFCSSFQSYKSKVYAIIK